MDRWVCLDVGETLIDETRVWSTWADELGIPNPLFSNEKTSMLFGDAKPSVEALVAGVKSA